LTYRKAVITDFDNIREILNSHMAKGPFMMQVVDELIEGDAYGFVVMDGNIFVGFVLVTDGFFCCRTDLEEYREMLALSEGKKVTTVTLMVVRDGYTGKGIARKMLDLVFEEMSKRGTDIVYAESMVPRDEENLPDGEKRYLHFERFTSEVLYEKYIPDYFYSPDFEDDYCYFCKGVCHCGTVLFLGHLKRCA